jgi:AraC-like DNA-binding protein
MEPLIQSHHNLLPVEIFTSEIRKVCGQFDVEPKSRTGMIDGGVTTKRFGAFDTAIVDINSVQIKRDKKAIRQDPGEYFFLLVQDLGCSHVQQEENITKLRPGDMFLVDSVKPSSFRYDNNRSRQISFHIPRDEAMHRFGNIGYGGISISRDDPLWLAIHSVLRKMITSDDTHQQSLGDAFLSLISAYLHTTYNVSHIEPSEQLLSRALALIDKHCLNSSFSPRDVAYHLNISERTLQRHFQILGETPRHRIINTRLEHAHTRLCLRKEGVFNESVTDIALSSGFNDLSYFYREFRKKYHITPGSTQ